MINNELSIDVSTDLNPKVMRIFDTSTYYVDEKVENYLLEVLPANRSQWVTFTIKKDFSLSLNSANLRYVKIGTSPGHMELPDGIYEFKQSYKPNSSTVQHYYHLRIISSLRDIYEYRDKLVSKQCKLSRAEYVQNRDKLRDIEEYLIAAQWAVEEKLDKVRGKEMYEFAVKQLEKYANECQCQ